MEKEFTLELWTMAVAMYEETDHSGIPLHKRQLPVRDAWRKAAQISIQRNELVYPISVLEEVAQ